MGPVESVYKMGKDKKEVKKANRQLRKFEPNQEYSELDCAHHFDGTKGLFVSQKPKVFELFGCEQTSDYNVATFKKKSPDTPSKGKQCMKVREQSGGCAGCCIRQFCADHRPFTMDVTASGNDKHMMKLVRPYRCPVEFECCQGVACCVGFCCCCSCCWCGNAEIQIFSGNDSSNPNVNLGSVKQNCSFCYHPAYSIRDPSDKVLYTIGGDCFLGCFEFCRSFEFPIKRPDSDQTVGMLKKHRGNMINSLLFDANDFSVKFPLEANPRERALLFAACYMVDFMHFEKGNDFSLNGPLGGGDFD